MPVKAPDLSGQQFGYLTALYPIKKNGKIYYMCRCICGKEKEIYGYSLRKGKTKSCGCMKGKLVAENKIQDISGQKFGRLTAIKIDHRVPPKTYWLCKCDCGGEKIVDINHLTQGKTKSCGCLDEENRKRLGRLNYNDLTGKIFGKLTVIEDSLERTPQGNVLWICQCECGNIKKIAGSHLLSGDTVSCGCTNSKGEVIIQKLLKENNIEYIQQYTFEDCINPLTNKKLFFDFYLPKYNRCIEFDGEQHYKPRERGFFTEEKVTEIQFRDKIKDKYCEEHNIDLVRILWYNIDNVKIEDLIKEK